MAIVSIDQLLGIAQNVVDRAQAYSTDDRACVVVLEGDLGAGKTTLIQHIGRILGITNSIISPTFTVMKRYEIPHTMPSFSPVLAEFSAGNPQDSHKNSTGNPQNIQRFTQLIHIDAYRIESQDELRPIGFESVLKTPYALVCIEWPEKISGLQPDIRIQLRHVRTEVGDTENMREITIEERK